MTATLDDICEAIVDCEHKTAPPGDGYALSVGTRAMKNGRLVVEACKPVSRMTYDGWTRRMRPRPGDLILAREAPVGQVVAVPEDRRLCLGQRTVLIRPDSSKVHPRFLHYWLLGPDAQVTMTGQAAGATVAHLNVEDIRALDVARLPIDVDLQAFAAATLGALDDLIENDRRRIELLEQTAQAIYREWFVRFRYPGHGENSLVDSPLDLIPEGWAVRTFADIASFVNGFAFKPEHWGADGRPIIKIRELKQGVTPDTPRCGTENLAQKYWVEPGDLLFSWSADLGAYRWSYEPGLLNQHLFTVIPNTGLSLAFLFRALDDAMPKFRDRAQGTTMRHIKRAALSEVSTIVPTQGLIALFTDAIEPIDRQVISLRGANGRLASMRDLLLPKLVTGQIDLSNLDLDALLDSVA